MEERISMSRKELSRLEVLTKVRERRLTILQVSNILGLSIRQVKYLFKALKLNGPRGLVSKKVGAKGSHHLDPRIKKEALTQKVLMKTKQKSVRGMERKIFLY